MSATTSLSVLIALLVAGAGLSLYDLKSDERRTIVVYTTPALRDLLEKEIVPRFERETRVEVSLVYVPAGQQYNRLRMGGDQGAEADLFLHASPLYLVKGASEGYVDPAPSTLGEPQPELGGEAWRAFAWSPLVAVHREGTPPPPDLATSDRTFGFPHPLLSANGASVVLFFEEVSPEAGERALAHTRVQPTNSRANIGGIADGSFDLTLGYEAVVRFYQDQGAKVAYEIPVVDGEKVTTPVLFSAALIHGERHPRSEDLFEFLFTNATQDALARYHFRSIEEYPNATAKEGFLDLADARQVHYDWSRWADLESKLSDYEVRS